MQTRRSRAPWLYWGSLLLGIAGWLAFTLYESEADVYLIGELTHGHYQIELACTSCHSTPFGGGAALQDACVECHGDDLRLANDAHPKTKFTDPRNADRVALLDARACITCHVEHHPERVRPMGVTLPDDFCVTCHKDIADDRPSHRDLAFTSCASGGCHNFHDNRGLYEDFLLAHRDEPEQLPVAQVPGTGLGKLMDAALEGPRTPLRRTDADVPPSVEVDAQHISDWEATAHARAGINCMDCHGVAVDGTEPTAWQSRPALSVCGQCHAPEAEGFKAGMHGMRLPAGLPPMRPELARRPMHADALARELDCGSCHGAHRFDVRRAAVESCMECHDDAHTNAYPRSAHARLWQAESDGAAPAGSGVSCATCHLPRAIHKHDGVETVLAVHNQNLNLRPNEKMLRSVCMNCHGLAFSIDALADAELVQRNFAGRPARHVPGIDWAARRLAEGGATESDFANQPRGEHE